MRGTLVMSSKSGIARLALAVALSTGLAAGGVVLGSSIAVAKSAPKASYSAEFTKAAGPFQKQVQELDAKKGKVADAEYKAAAAAIVGQLGTVEAVAKSPSDKLLLGQWQQQLGIASGDNALSMKGLQNMLDSGLLEPDKVTLVNSVIGSQAYQAKDYATAVRYLAPISAASTDDGVVQMLAESYAAQNQPTQALDALKAAITARKAAGGVVPQDWYSRANRIAYAGKLGPQSVEWAMALVEAFPSPFNWLGATQIVRNASPAYTNQETLDMSRLMDRSGALTQDPKYVGREYIEYIQAADFRRLPGEVARIAQAGIASGALQASDTSVSEALTQSKSRITADKASLPALARDAASASTGVTALAAGDAFLSYGEAAKAEEMYEMALKKGGIDKDRALTRQGIAEVDQAKYDEAKATFAQVSGTRTQMAQLWSAYAAQKAAGK